MYYGMIKSIKSIYFHIIMSEILLRGISRPYLTYIYSYCLIHFTKIHAFQIHIDKAVGSGNVDEDI